MATLEVKVTWCDQHLQEGIEVPGTPRAIALDGLMGTVDLCDPCFKELTAKLLFLLESAGQTVTEPEPAQEPVDIYADPAKRKRAGIRYKGKRQFVCILCWEDYGSVSGWRHHMEVAHGIDDARIGDVHGDVCPLDGKHMGSGRPSATLHARDVHRINNVTRLFERAAKRGDKYGIVAERRSALSAS